MATCASLRAFVARPCDPRATRRSVVTQAATQKTAGAPAAIKIRDAGSSTRQGTARQV